MIDWELVAAIIIILVMLFLARQQGRSNPVNTGDLEKRVYDDIHKIKNEMQALEGRFAQSATKKHIEDLRQEIADTAADRAEKSSKEFSRIREQVTTVCTKVEGIEKSADRTANGVDRLERYFLELGIKGGGK